MKKTSYRYSVPMRIHKEGRFVTATVISLIVCLEIMFSVTDDKVTAVMR